MNRTRTACRLAGALLVSLVLTSWVLSGGPAYADAANPNTAEYYEALGYGECVYSEPGGTSVTLPPLTNGNGYTLLVIKAGSTQSNDDGEAQKEFTYPSAGTVYVGPLNANDEPRQISHIIVCQGPLVTPVSPTVTQANCTGGVASKPSYSVVATEGVKYFVGDTEVSGTVEAVEGTQVVVTAKPASNGYVLSGAQTFTLTFDDIVCSANKTSATPVTPIFLNSACQGGVSSNSASYTIPATTGVDYLVNGSVKAAGTYPAADNTTVTVTAQAQATYELTASAGFSHTFSAPVCAANSGSSVDGVAADTAVGGVKAGNDEAEEAEEAEVAVQGTKTGTGSDLLAATGAGVPLVGIAALGLILLIGGAVLIAAPARLAVARGQHRSS